MHALRGMRGTFAGLALAAFSLGLVPATASAKPGPGEKPGGFKLLARSVGFINTNRVFYGLTTRGEIGTDSSGAGTSGGGYWPRGTNNEYMFNSGFQFAGIIGGAKPANPWGGDTTGAMLFDATGPRKHGAEVTPIYRGQDPNDVAIWPEVGMVPQGDASELLFDPLLRGNVNASQGDVYWITWDGDPAFISSRPHPLGLLVEHRGLAWNYPSGNEDILYFIITFYNITSRNAADYAEHRPAMRDLLIQKANDFHTLNNARFGITLPTAGYAINELYAAFASDPDVGLAGNDYSSVNLPFALGYAYQGNFPRLANWVFDPSIFGSPFFPGVGFVGVKYLKGPEGPGAIQLFSNTCNGTAGCPADPNNTTRLWRYLSGKLDPNQGDVVCRTPGNPAVTHVCYVGGANLATGSDVRFFQSSNALTLAPGKSASVVVAYIHAAPVAIPGFTPAANLFVNPNEPLRIASVDSMIAQNGVNRIDSISGFKSFKDGTVSRPADGIPQQDEFTVVPGSLLGKANVAQQVFDAKFLLPFSPEPPDFFLISGNAQVTVLWKPTTSETTGDPYFAVAGSPTTTGPGGVAANALYDPNYRRFDVEGYRVYRGRLDAPGSLRLIAQFDYSGTVFSDYAGYVVQGGGLDATPQCAPEQGLVATCRAAFAPVVPGTPSTVKFDYNLTGQFVQVLPSGRDRLANGSIILLQADTLGVTTVDPDFPPLANTGVPFVYIDRDVRNGVRYFYAVTAFDVNSVKSAPATLESAKVSKQIVVGGPAGNFNNTAVVQQGIFGRKGLLTDNAEATIATDGRFNKAAPPANGMTVSLAGFVPAVLKGTGEASITFDSATITSFAEGAAANATGTNNYFTIVSGAGTTKITVPLGLSAQFTSVTASGSFDALAIDPALAATYGGGAGYKIPGAWALTVPGQYYTGIQGRACANSQGGNTSRANQCWYNGPRWFVGANETKANPNVAAPVVNAGTAAVANANFNNAGELPGVATVHHPDSYGYLTGLQFRPFEQIVSVFGSAADYKLYWGAAGKVDSVIDITHDRPIPFGTTIGNSFGVLNPSAVAAVGSPDQRAELTATDFACVAPARSFAASALGCTLNGVTFSQTATPGPLSFGTGAINNLRTSAAAANNGIGLYVKGRIFLIEFTGGAVPATGTVWTMRDYTGVLYGGNGAGGDLGAYQFIPRTRPFNVPGVAAKFSFNVTNELVATTDDALARIHTVPDPYYVTSAYDRQVASKVINFVNVPTDAKIRIYTVSGILVRVLDNTTTQNEGTVTWDVRNRSNQFVASGVYFYHIESGGKSRVGRMTIVNYAK